MSANETGNIELGTLRVAAVNDGGAEIRLSDEKKGTTIVLYGQKALASVLRQGQTGTLLFVPDAVPEVETLLVEMPANETAGLNAHAKVVEQGGKKAKKG
jgi:hypothetical protein